MDNGKHESKLHSIESLILENKGLINQFYNLKTRYDLFKQSSAVGYWEWDIVNSTLETSDRWKHTLGITDLNKSLTVSDWSNRIHPDDIERVIAELDKHLEGHNPYYRSEYRIRHEDGHYLNFIDRGQASFSPQGHPELVIGSCINITDKVEKTRQLAKNEKTLNTILSCMSEGILVIDKDGEFIYANENFSKLVGLSIDQVKGTTPTDPRYKVIHEDGSDYPGETHPSSYTLRTGIPVKDDIQGIIFNGETHWVSVNTTPMFKMDSEEVLGVVITFTDITEKLKKEEHIKKLAFVDYLTGLGNRNSLTQRLNTLINDKSKKSSAVLMIDLDHFKMINDSRGHLVGDKLLQRVAKRFLSVKRESDFIARSGGDEFMVIIPNVNKAQANEIAQRFIDSLNESISINSFLINVSASIGICMLPDDGETFESLMMHSDIAMYYAKSCGRGCVRSYEPQLSSQLKERHEISNALAKAVEYNELDIHYQPQVDSRNGKVIGAEALLRWKHPTLGNIPPDKFIPIAEDSGIIVSIGKWLIEKVCQTICELNNQKQSIKIAINLSAKQVGDPELLPYVDSLLKKYKLAGNSISFELTESVLISQNNTTEKNISGLNKLGVDLAIDDFGTGYSCLTYLKHLPIKCLKIDKSFIDKITTSKTDKAITNTIVSLTQIMSIKVLAEGVETMEQISTLKELDCHLIQGYFYSKPLHFTELKTYLSKNIINTFASEMACELG